MGWVYYINHCFCFTCYCWIQELVQFKWQKSRCTIILLHPLGTSKQQWCISIVCCFSLGKYGTLWEVSFSLSRHCTETLAGPLGDLRMTASCVVWLLDSFWVCQQTSDVLPFPSATRGFPFFFHEIIAAGFASVATQVPSWTKQKREQKNKIENRKQ